MQIPDLSYLQSVSEDEIILGSVRVSVLSEALSFSSDIYSFASVNSTSRSYSSDDYTADGTGFSEAFGDDPIANVRVAGDGDVVVGKTQNNFSDNTAVASGYVFAIDSLGALTFR